jgi:hypothetical protein
MESFGRRCDLIIYEGEKHAFFNKDDMYILTMRDTETFLVSLGFLDPLQ